MSILTHRALARTEHGEFEHHYTPKREAERIAAQHHRDESAMLFIRLRGAMFPIQARTPSGDAIEPDHVTVYTPETAARLTGCSTEALRRFWLNSVGAREICGLAVLI